MVQLLTIYHPTNNKKKYIYAQMYKQKPTHSHIASFYVLYLYQFPCYYYCYYYLYTK